MCGLGRGAGRGKASAASGAERYTVIVIGDRAKSIRKFRLDPRRLSQVLVGVVVLGVGLGVAAGAGFAHDVLVVRTGSENRRLKEENLALRSRIHRVQERVEQIAATLDRVERHDAKLRSTLEQMRGPELGSASGSAATRGGDDGALDGASVPESTKGAALPAGLAALETTAARQESSLEDLQQYFDDQRALLASSPSTWPTRGWVTSDFGARLDPYTAQRMMHEGLDIATPQGQTIYAPSDGTVVFAGTETGYGKVVVLDHGHGVNTRYGHLSAIYVKRGEHVKRGSRVAAVGNTGRSTGPHLHYEVRVNGIAENPREFILQ